MQEISTEVQTGLVGLFYGQPWYVLIMGLLIVASALVIWKIAPSYFDTKRMQSEIDELKVSLSEEKNRNQQLMEEMEIMRKQHASDIARLNERLLDLATSVMAIKKEYDKRS